MQTYVVVMAVLVVVGTLYDVLHKKSARYFLNNLRNKKDQGAQKVSSGKLLSVAVETAVVDVLASGEFCNMRAQSRPPPDDVWIHRFRSQHCHHGVLLSDILDARARHPGAIVDHWCIDGLSGRLLVLVFHSR